VFDRPDKRFGPHPSPPGAAGHLRVLSARAAPRARRAALLRRQGRTLDQIATTLGVSRGTVRNDLEALALR
jgi:DNA-binding CsgD family transcriptional regulator